MLTDLTPEDARGWHLKLGNETIGEAILNRIIHDFYQILIDEKNSMRERHGLESSFQSATANLKLSIVLQLRQ